MKKIAFILITSAIYLVGCSTDSTDNHGHEHGPNGEHMQDGDHGHSDHGHNNDDSHHGKHHEQEEFVVSEDSTEASMSHGDHNDHDHQH